MQPYFRKGDRIERLRDWPSNSESLAHKTGTVWEDTYDPETIRWRVDGYPYTETNYHIITSADVRRLTSIQGVGLNCKACNNPNPWAKPNQPDGKTYICFECRN